MWWDMVKSEKGNFVRKDDTKILGEKEGSGQETTLIGVYAHVEVHTTHFSLHVQSGSSQSSLVDSIKFFFLFKGGKKLLHQDRDIDHFVGLLHFAGNLPQFLNTLNSGILSWHHTRQCTESVAPRQFSAPLWAAPCAQWPTRLTRLRSRLVRCFHLASFRVLFSIRALPSIAQFISFQTTTHLLSVILFPIQNIARVHPLRDSDLANSFS